jgi:hypothetical protein
MGYQRILDPKGVQTFERNNQMKQKDFMKVEEENVHHNKYDGHYTKQ